MVSAAQSRRTRQRIVFGLSVLIAAVALVASAHGAELRVAYDASTASLRISSPQCTLSTNARGFLEITDADGSILSSEPSSPACARKIAAVVSGFQASYEVA